MSEGGPSCGTKHVTCGACSNGRQFLWELNGTAGDLVGVGELQNWCGNPHTVFSEMVPEKRNHVVNLRI